MLFYGLAIISLCCCISCFFEKGCSTHETCQGWCGNHSMSLGSLSYRTKHTRRLWNENLYLALLFITSNSSSTKARRTFFLCARGIQWTGKGEQLSWHPWRTLINIAWRWLRAQVCTFVTQIANSFASRSKFSTLGENDYTYSERQLGAQIKLKRGIWAKRGIISL